MSVKAGNVRKWSDEQLLREVRNPIRADMPDTYPVLFAEMLARILERLPGAKTKRSGK